MKFTEEQEKQFNHWLDQFVEDHGHSWGMGFYVELRNGDVLYNGTDEYESWYNAKKEEFLKIVG